MAVQILKTVSTTLPWHPLNWMSFNGKNLVISLITQKRLDIIDRAGNIIRQLSLGADTYRGVVCIPNGYLVFNDTASKVETRDFDANIINTFTYDTFHWTGLVFDGKYPFTLGGSLSFIYKFDRQGNTIRWWPLGPLNPYDAAFDGRGFWAVSKDDDKLYYFDQDHNLRQTLTLKNHSAIAFDGKYLWTTTAANDTLAINQLAFS